MPSVSQRASTGWSNAPPAPVRWNSGSTPSTARYHCRSCGCTSSMRRSKRSTAGTRGPNPVAEPGIMPRQLREVTARPARVRVRRQPHRRARDRVAAFAARHPDLAEGLRVGDVRLHEPEQPARLLHVIRQEEVEQRVVVEGAGERRDHRVLLGGRATTDVVPEAGHRRRS